MLRLSAGTPRLCDGLNRRTFFRVGAASGAGLCLNLPGLLKAASGGSRAKSLILFALEGGPAHIDLWDMKPDAPEADPRRVPADRHHGPRPGLLRTSADARPAGASPDAGPLGASHHRRPQRRLLLRHDRPRPRVSGAADHRARRPTTFPAIGSVLAKLRPIGPPPARLRAHARLDEQQRLVPARPGRRLPGRVVRPVPGRRPEPARLPGARPGPAPRAVARPFRPPPRRCWTRSTAHSATGEAGRGARRPLPQGVRADLQPRGPARVRPRQRAATRSASATGSTPTTRATRRPASSAACRTWASACCWPAG